MKTNMKRKVAAALDTLTLMTAGSAAMISAACAEGVATRFLDCIDSPAVVETVDQDQSIASADDHVCLVRPYIHHQ